MNPEQARRLWHALEPINAVTYFCAETLDAYDALGFTGFWMGYFASRAAPMGRVEPATIDATFFNFHPGRVRRAIPEAWEHAEPAAVLSARSTAAAASLRRLLDPSGAQTLASAVTPVLRAAVERGSPSGRPLFAANQCLEVGDDPVAALWQLATTLREHRGDGHVALLTANGLSGIDALILFSLSEGIEAELFRTRRGWSEDEWSSALQRLASRSLVSGDGSLTAGGSALRVEVERHTDELAAEPFEHLSARQVDRLWGDLEGPARVIAAAGEIAFPNPMGLPAPRA